MSAPVTGRRELLGAAGVALTAAAAAVALGPRLAGALVAEGDEERLVRLIEREQELATAYRALAAGDLLDREVRAAAELFAEQERQHAEALSAALEDLGGSAPRAPDPADVQGLGAVTSQRAALELLVEREVGALDAYADAAVGFEASDLVATAAQISANQAQHLVVFRQQLGEEPLPNAVVTED